MLAYLETPTEDIGLLVCSLLQVPILPSPRADEEGHGCNDISTCSIPLHSILCVQFTPGFPLRFALSSTRFVQQQRITDCRALFLLHWSCLYAQLFGFSRSIRCQPLVFGDVGSSLLFKFLHQRILAYAVFVGYAGGAISFKNWTCIFIWLFLSLLSVTV